MLATYHNHSSWSDGKASVPQIVASAIQQGIGEVGISDHYCLHPNGEPQKWAMDPARIDDYIAELKSIQHEFNSRESTAATAVRIGVEADWFEGRAHVIGAALERLPLDYVVGSVHFVGPITIDGHPDVWQRMSESERNSVHREYWRQVRLMAEARLFDIAAHLDLPKKFGFFATTDLSREISEALDALAAANMVVELNTAGWHKPCSDAYPTLDILTQCAARGIRTTISADAHEPAHLVRDFDRAADRLRAAGYRDIARFKDRTVWLEPLTATQPV